jgi:hypothetical protein
VNQTADAGTPRRRGRFQAMVRARPTGLALAALGVTIAAILGVQMGHSAISEINPVHFQGPLERPRAVAPPPELPEYDPYSRQYTWTMPPQPPITNCAAPCDTRESRAAMRLAMDESAGRDATLPYWRDATPATELQPWAPGAVPDRGRGIERYMHYPVNREQREALERVQAETPAPAPVPVPLPLPVAPHGAPPQPAAVLSVERLAHD